jgi:hypothetical protein
MRKRAHDWANEDDDQPGPLKKARCDLDHEANTVVTPKPHLPIVPRPQPRPTWKQKPSAMVVSPVVGGPAQPAKTLEMLSPGGEAPLMLTLAQPPTTPEEPEYSSMDEDEAQGTAVDSKMLSPSASPAQNIPLHDITDDFDFDKTSIATSLITNNSTMRPCAVTPPCAQPPHSDVWTPTFNTGRVPQQ